MSGIRLLSAENVARKRRLRGESGLDCFLGIPEAGIAESLNCVGTGVLGCRHAGVSE